VFSIELQTYPSVDIIRDIGYEPKKDNLFDVILKTANFLADARIRLFLLDKHFFYFNMIYSRSIIENKVKFRTLNECLKSRECKKYARIVRKKYKNASLKRTLIIYGESQIPILIRRIFGNYYIEPIYTKRTQFLYVNISIIRRSRVIPYVPYALLNNKNVPPEISIVNTLVYHKKLPNDYTIIIPKELNNLFNFSNVEYGDNFEIITPLGERIEVNIGHVYKYKKKFYLLPTIKMFKKES